MGRVVVLGVALGAVLLAGGCGGGGGGGEKTLTTRTARYVVRLSLDRVAVGERETVVGVEVRDEAARPVTAAAVTILPVMVEMGHAMAALAAEVEPAAPGRYRARGVVFGMAGAWDLDVRVRVAGRSEVARFSIEVG